MNTRHSIIPAAYVFLKRDGKILLARRHNTGYQDGTYQPPAGHVEANESPTQGAVRELKEEIGINIDPKDLRIAHIMYRPSIDSDVERVDFFFTCETWTGKPSIQEPEKCDDLMWAALDALPENLTLHTPQVLEAIQNGVLYSEAGYD